MIIQGTLTSGLLLVNVVIFLLGMLLYLLFVWLIRRYTHCSPMADGDASLKDIIRLYRERNLELERMAEQNGVVLEQ